MSILPEEGAPIAAARSRRAPSPRAAGRHRGASSPEARAPRPAGKPPAGSPPAGGARPQPRTPAARRPAGRGFAPAAKKLTLFGTGKAAVKIVAAEFVICLVALGIAPVVQRKPNNGHLYVADDFVRLTAMSLVFFTLGLTANTPRGGKFAAAFGGLVTLGVLNNSTGTFSTIGNVFTTAQATKGQEFGASAGTQLVPTATYQPVSVYGDPSHPDAPIGTSGGSGGGLSV